MKCDLNYPEQIYCHTSLVQIVQIADVVQKMRRHKSNNLVDLGDVQSNDDSLYAKFSEYRSAVNLSHNLNIAGSMLLIFSLMALFLGSWYAMRAIENNENIGLRGPPGPQGIAGNLNVSNLTIFTEQVEFLENITLENSYVNFNTPACSPTEGSIFHSNDNCDCVQIHPGICTNSMTFTCPDSGPCNVSGNVEFLDNVTMSYLELLQSLTIGNVSFDVLSNGTVVVDGDFIIERYENNTLTFPFLLGELAMVYQDGNHVVYETLTNNSDGLRVVNTTLSLDENSYFESLVRFIEDIYVMDKICLGYNATDLWGCIRAYDNSGENRVVAEIENRFKIEALSTSNLSGTEGTFISLTSKNSASFNFSDYDYDADTGAFPLKFPSNVELETENGRIKADAFVFSFCNSLNESYYFVDFDKGRLLDGYWNKLQFLKDNKTTIDDFDTLIEIENVTNCLRIKGNCINVEGNMTMQNYLSFGNAELYIGVNPSNSNGIIISSDDVTFTGDVTILGEINVTDINLSGGLSLMDLNVTENISVYGSNSFIDSLRVNILIVNNSAQFNGFVNIFGSTVLLSSNTEFVTNGPISITSTLGNVNCSNPVFRPDTLSDPYPDACIPECWDHQRCEDAFKSLNVIENLGVGNSIQYPLPGGFVEFGSSGNPLTSIRGSANEVLFESNTGVRLSDSLLDLTGNTHPCCTGQQVDLDLRTLSLGNTQLVYIPGVSVPLQFDSILNPTSTLAPFWDVPTASYLVNSPQKLTITIALQFDPAQNNLGTIRGVRLVVTDLIPVVQYQAVYCVTPTTAFVSSFVSNYACSFTRLFPTGGVRFSLILISDSAIVTVLGGVGNIATRMVITPT